MSGPQEFFCKHCNQTFLAASEPSRCEFCQAEGGLTTFLPFAATHAATLPTPAEREAAARGREDLAQHFRWAVWSLVGWMALIGLANGLLGVALIASEESPISGLKSAQASILGKVSIGYGLLILALTYHVARHRMWAVYTFTTLFAVGLIASSSIVSDKVQSGDFLPLAVIVLIGFSLERVFKLSRQLREAATGTVPQPS